MFALHILLLLYIEKSMSFMFPQSITDSLFIWKPAAIQPNAALRLNQNMVHDISTKVFYGTQYSFMNSVFRCVVLYLCFVSLYGWMTFFLSKIDCMYSNEADPNRRKKNRETEHECNNQHLLKPMVRLSKSTKFVVLQTTITVFWNEGIVADK